MIFAMLAYLFSVILDVLCLFGQSDQEKDVEILLLRQQFHASCNGLELVPLVFPGGRNCPWSCWLANLFKGLSIPALG